VQLHRPVDNGLDPISDVLVYADWVAVTGGYPWTRGHQQDRHNLLATELGMRIAELGDVGAVLGESLSRHDLLSPRFAGDTANRCADLAVLQRVRGHSDGGPCIMKTFRGAVFRHPHAMTV
jgi:hypothetical protein